MSCLHPLKAFEIGVTKNGKPQYKVVPYGTDHVYKDTVTGEWKCADSAFRGQREARTIRPFIEIPCGKCIECRLKYSRDWAGRMVLESSKYEHNWFITLTYDDEHITINDYLDEKTGEFGESPTLVKSDLQKFIKRLRDHKKDAHIKYYACGEYGDGKGTRQNGNPHYHAIVFNCDFPDRIPWKRVKGGFWLYRSPELEQIWTAGISCIGEVNFDTCAYVARYVMKKAKGEEAEKYEKYNYTPEFTCMSLKPAIGREFYDKHKEELYKHSYITVPARKGGIKIFNSRYFDKLLEKENETLYNEIKAKRKETAEAIEAAKLARTTKGYTEMLEAREANLEAKIKGLIRPL